MGSVHLNVTLCEHLGRDSSPQAWRVVFLSSSSPFPLSLRAMPCKHSKYDNAEKVRLKICCEKGLFVWFFFVNPHHKLMRIEITWKMRACPSWPLASSQHPQSPSPPSQSSPPLMSKAVKCKNKSVAKTEWMKVTGPCRRAPWPHPSDCNRFSRESPDSVQDYHHYFFYWQSQFGTFMWGKKRFQESQSPYHMIMIRMIWWWWWTDWLDRGHLILILIPILILILILIQIFTHSCCWKTHHLYPSS